MNGLGVGKCADCGNFLVIEPEGVVDVIVGGGEGARGPANGPSSSSSSGGGGGGGGGGGAPPILEPRREDDRSSLSEAAGGGGGGGAGRLRRLDVWVETGGGGGGGGLPLAGGRGGTLLVGAEVDDIDPELGRLGSRGGAKPEGVGRGDLAGIGGTPLPFTESVEGVRSGSLGGRTLGRGGAT